MKRIRHSPEQIVTKLYQAAREMAGGKKIEEVCKALSISPATHHRWQAQYGGADLNTVKELKALKEENAKLKKLVADLSLDKVALKELLEGKWQARRANARRWDISSAIWS
jgi:transposase-like protein